MSDLQQFFPVLSNGSVEFILVGGMAGVVHGAARVTYDLDVVYARRSDNFKRLEQALKPYQPYLRGAPKGLPFTWDVRTIRNGLNFTLTTTLGDIDLFGEILGGGTYQELLPHTILVKAFGVDLRCVDLPTLIKLKRAAGRPRDFEAIAELEALLNQL